LIPASALTARMHLRFLTLQAALYVSLPGVSFHTAVLYSVERRGVEPRTAARVLTFPRPRVTLSSKAVTAWCAVTPKGPATYFLSPISRCPHGTARRLTRARNGFEPLAGLDPAGHRVSGFTACGFKSSRRTSPVLRPKLPQTAAAITYRTAHPHHMVV
jgi:hypothetical protein